VSGAVCLEFANTIENYRLDNPLDFFSRYEDMLAWSLDQGLVSEATSAHLSRKAEADASQAADVFAAAKVLRARIYRVFSAIAHGIEPARADVSSLNRELSGALTHLQLEGSEGRYRWFWCDQATRLDSLVWPVLRSAAELLVAPGLQRLRQCNGDKCTWLFLDRSKNRSRRWCHMQICGNRAKSRRHYARSRAPA
jgi:predicted RNA-binding Zn ribbon-like protein